MQRFARILSSAFNCVWERKNLWPIAFLQFVSLPLAIRMLRFFIFDPVPRVLSALSLLVVFSFSTVILWLTVKAYIEKQSLNVKLIDFFRASASVFGFTALGILAGLFLKSLALHWLVLVLLLSLVNAALVAVMLSSVLFSLNFKRSLALTLDFWNRKFSFISTMVFVVLFAHGMSYYLAHAFWPQARQNPQFSVSKGSATIWMLLVISAIVAAFFASFLNAFLVILFLDTAKPIKDPETVKVLVPQPAIDPIVGS